MTISNQDRFGIIFTIALVDFVLVIIQLLSSNFQFYERILIIVICGIVISIIGFFSYRKKPIYQSFVLTNRSYMLFFIIGVFLGLLIRMGIGIAYGIDYQHTQPASFYYGISLAFGGYFGLYFFTGMSMAVSVIQIPFIKIRIHGDTRWIPCIGGVAFGFGIMTFSQLFWNPIPKLL